MTPVKSKRLLRGHIITETIKKKGKSWPPSLSVGISKARFELPQGKQMVEIRGKLADVNDDKAAHSLSTKKCGLFCHEWEKETEWTGICWQLFKKSWASLRVDEEDDYFSSLPFLVSVTLWS